MVPDFLDQMQCMMGVQMLTLCFFPYYEDSSFLKASLVFVVIGFSFAFNIFLFRWITAPTQGVERFVRQAD